MEPPSPFPVNELTPAAQGSKKWEMRTQSLIHHAGWSFSGRGQGPPQAGKALPWGCGLTLGSSHL